MNYFAAICGIISALPLYAHNAPLGTNPIDIEDRLTSIEHQQGVKIGLYAYDTNNKHVIAHHAEERFPFQSTFKMIGVGALLYQDDRKPIIDKKVSITPQDMVSWHPISGKYINKDVPLKVLAEGAIAYSDNTAINKIIEQIGGINQINRFARISQNPSFKLKHIESNLNSDPKKEMDTATPKDMAASVQHLLLGDVLSQGNRSLLKSWMQNNTTGYKRIRAGVPLGWTVADKTGSGSFGVANDVGMAWSANCKPIILSIYTYKPEKTAKTSDAAIAEVTQAVMNSFAQHNPCFNHNDVSDVSEILIKNKA